MLRRNSFTTDVIVPQTDFLSINSSHLPTYSAACTRCGAAITKVLSLLRLPRRKDLGDFGFEIAAGVRFGTVLALF